MGIESELNATETVELLWRYKAKILLPTVLMGILAILWIILPERQFMAESVISVPYQSNQLETGGPRSAKEFILDIPSTKYIVNNYARRVVSKDTSVSKYLIGISVQDITGSDRFFKLNLRSRGNGEIAVEISEKILEYLRKNEYVTKRIDGLKERRLKEIKDLSESTAMTEKLVNDLAKDIHGGRLVGCDPGHIIMDLAEMKSKLRSMEEENFELYNFQLVEKPVVSSVDRNAYTKIVTFLFLGFFMGLFWILIAEYNKK